MSLYEDQLEDDDQLCHRCLYSNANCLCPGPVQVAVAPVVRKSEAEQWSEYRNEIANEREWGERKWLEECRAKQAENRYAVDGKPTHHDELLALARTYGELRFAYEVKDAFAILRANGHKVEGKRFWE